MQRIPLVRIEMVRERNLEYDSKMVQSPADAAAIISQFLATADREHFICLCLDTKNKVTALNVVSVGNLNTSIVHPRELFKPAILANACSIILAHNHPSGDPTPSREDMEVTRRICEAGELLDIPVLDHVVIGDSGRFVSLKERGII